VPGGVPITAPDMVERSSAATEQTRLAALDIAPYGTLPAASIRLRVIDV
jgi:hypothetical protein